MGKVVDTEFRVKGVQGLRVVDASVYPVPITGHLQAVTYAMAQQAAEIIGAEVSTNDTSTRRIKRGWEAMGAEVGNAKILNPKGKCCVF